MMSSSRIITLFLFVSTAFFLLVSCGQFSKKGNVVISGTFGNFAGEDLILNEVEVQTFTPLDTISLDGSGSFTHYLDLSEAGIYQLKFDNRNYLTLIVHPGEEIRVSSNSDKITRNYEVSGSPDSEILDGFEDQMHQKRLFLDDYYHSLPADERSSNPLLNDQEMISIFDSLAGIHRQYVVDQINRKPNSLANLLMINRRFGVKKVFDEKEDFGLFVLIDSALINEYPNNKHVKDHHRRMEQVSYRLQAEAEAAKRLAPGQPAPDLSLPGINGELVSLRSLLGKKVLLYFWSSGNAVCRVTNTSLRDNYAGFKRKGLEIFGVSLDSYEDMWKAAVKVDKLSWINVREESGSVSPVILLYQLTSDLPYFYLIDENQKIIARTGDFDAIMKEINNLPGL